MERSESAAESASEHAALDAALDGLIERYGSGQWEAEVLAARHDYSERTGRVFEEDELYEARTSAFLEWYVVERSLAGGDMTPVEIDVAKDADSALVAWSRSHRSVFLIEDAEGPRVRLTDLLGGAEFEVEERRRLHGVGPGDVVEARLIGYLGKVRFGRTFMYHPAAAREAIVRQGRACLAQGGTRADAVELISRLRVRALRYKHMAPEKVYEMGMPSPGTGEHKLPPR